MYVQIGPKQIGEYLKGWAHPSNYFKIKLSDVFKDKNFMSSYWDGYLQIGESKEENEDCLVHLSGFQWEWFDDKGKRTKYMDRWEKFEESEKIMKKMGECYKKHGVS